MTAPTVLRIGVVGAGVVSRSHVPHLLRLGAEVVAFSPRGAADLVQEWGIGETSSFEELLARVDVVDVLSPTPTHHRIVTLALQAGKDVICEKPLARTPQEAAELVDLAESVGRHIYPGHVARFFPELRELSRAVTSGALGELAVLRFSRSGAFPTRSDWFADPDASGGVIMDQMIHDLDLARWIAGEVTTVSAVSRRRGSAVSPVETAHVLLTHASGAISQVSGAWGAAHSQFTTSFSVSGTQGYLEHDSVAERAYNTDLARDDGAGAALPETFDDDPFFLELQEFTAAMLGGPTPRVNARDGVEAVRLADAALRSVQVGQPVMLSGSDR